MHRFNRARSAYAQWHGRRISFMPLYLPGFTSVSIYTGHSKTVRAFYVDLSDFDQTAQTVPAICTDSSKRYRNVT